MSNVSPQEKLLSIGEFFGHSESYAVPVYQREYAWGREQINDLTTDLAEFIKEEDPYYLLGQVIAAPHSGHEQWSLVDGQQRTTTLFLLLLAIRRTLTKFNAPDMPAALDVTMQEVKSMTWFTAAGSTVKPRLAVAPGGEDIINKLLGGEKLPGRTSNNTQKNLKSAYEMLEEFVTGYMQHELDHESVVSLFKRIASDVYLVRLVVPDQAQALDVFAKLNNRGLRLNSADLLKNLLFQEVEDAEYVQLSNSWEEALKELYRCKGRVGSMDFLMKSMLSARSGESFSAKKVFKGWEKLILEDHEVDARTFGFSLPERAKELANLGLGLTAQGAETDLFAGTSYFGQVQHIPVLLAGAHLAQPAAQQQLAKLVEDRAVLSLLSKELSQEFERIIAPWANKVRQLNSDADAGAVRDASADALSTVEERLKALKFNLLNLSYEKDTERSRIRYILARTTRRVQIQASAEAKQLQDYLRACKNPMDETDQGYHLEHIHPQALIDSAQDAEWNAERVHSIGNLTLLNPYLNRLAGANDPENKVQYLGASGLLLTHWLVDVDAAEFSGVPNRKLTFDGIRLSAPETVAGWTGEAVGARARLYWKLLTQELCETFAIPSERVLEE